MELSSQAMLGAVKTSKGVIRVLDKSCTRLCFSCSWMKVPFKKNLVLHYIRWACKLFGYSALSTKSLWALLLIMRNSFLLSFNFLYSTAEKSALFPNWSMACRALSRVESFYSTTTNQLSSVKVEGRQPVTIVPVQKDLTWCHATAVQFYCSENMVTNGYSYKGEMSTWKLTTAGLSPFCLNYAES